MNQLFVIFTAGLLTCGQLYAQTRANPQMVFVDGGNFIMGDSTEKPAHLVTISNFSIGKYEVTVAEYKAFCQATKQSLPETPTWGWIDNHPITMTNFNDANAYCNWLSKETGQNYRLPTEAEWEYAARGGRKSKGFIYSGSNDPDEAGWSKNNAGDQAQAVGQKIANELGIYDMSGNVWEWCSDWHAKYSDEAQINPTGPTNGRFRVLRGGCWWNAASYCRVATRNDNSPEYRNSRRGFRVVLPE